MILLSVEFFRVPILIILPANDMLKWTRIKHRIALGRGDSLGFLGRQAPARDAHQHAPN